MEQMLDTIDINFKLAPTPIAEEFKINRRFMLASLNNFKLAPTPIAEEFKINRRFMLASLNNCMIMV